MVLCQSIYNSEYNFLPQGIKNGTIFCKELSSEKIPKTVSFGVNSKTSKSMQRKDISKYIYKYFIEKDEKENFVKGIVKWEQKLDTELDGSHCFLFPFCVITCYLEVYDAEV
jgi:hypothetical protein